MTTHCCPTWPCPICQSHMAQVPVPAPPRTPHKCPICYGRGTVEHNFYTRSGVGNATGRISCKACLGSGVLWS